MNEQAPKDTSRDELAKKLRGARKIDPAMAEGFRDKQTETPEYQTARNEKIEAHKTEVARRKAEEGEQITSVKNELLAKMESEKKEEKWSPVENQRLFVKRSGGQIERDWTVSQIIGDIATIYKPSPDNPKENIIKRIPFSDLEKINNRNNIDYQEAENFNDLYKLIKFQGGIKGNSQDYSPEILIEIIDKVKNGKIELNMITRTNNLRFAVEKLIKNNLRERNK